MNSVGRLGLASALVWIVTVTGASAQWLGSVQAPWRSTDIGDVGIAQESRDGDLVISGPLRATSTIFSEKATEPTSTAVGNVRNAFERSLLSAKSRVI